MTVVMRNTQTGEVRALPGDSQSAEYIDLKNQRRTDSRPMWEETGMHDAVALSGRIGSGAVRPEDIGDDGQPFNQITGLPVMSDLRPSSEFDRGQPTQTELDSGAGRAAVSSNEDFVPTELGEQDLSTAAAAEGTGSLEDGESTRELTDSNLAQTTVTPLTQAGQVTPDDEMADDEPDEEEDFSDAEQAEVQNLVDTNSKEALQTQAGELGLPQSGSKEDIAERIVIHRRS